MFEIFVVIILSVILIIVGIIAVYLKSGFNQLIKAANYITNGEKDGTSRDS